MALPSRRTRSTRLPEALAHPVRHSGDGRDDHREPGNHHGSLFDDPAGHPARLAAAPSHQADVGARLRAIYIGVVNWVMMTITIGLTLAFRKSDGLAAAYGIAVSATMLMTSVLLFMAMAERLNWGLPLSIAVAGSFIIVDSAFFVANAAKIEEGGYIPIALAIVVFSLMWIWRSGRDAILQVLKSRYIRTDTFLKALPKGRAARAGIAVFLTRSKEGVPPVMSWHLKHNRSLHESVMVINVSIEPVPFVRPEDRLRFFPKGLNLWRATVNYGFMERPGSRRSLRRERRGL